MAARAKLRFVRIPPRKARMVADMIRGIDANEANSMLRYVPNRGARIISKLLKSAISNATAEGKIDADTLFVKEIQVDPGPTMKRFMPRAMGRATRINKRTSHITLVLGER